MLHQLECLASDSYIDMHRMHSVGMLNMLDDSTSRLIPQLIADHSMNQFMDAKAQKISSIKILQDINDAVDATGVSRQISQRILRRDSRQLIRDMMPYLKSGVSSNSNLNMSFNLSNKVSWLMPHHSIIDKLNDGQSIHNIAMPVKTDLSQLKKRASRQAMITIENKRNMPRLVPRSRVACICKKTYCKKLYCICFKNGLPCTEFCQCEECCNKDAPLVQCKRVFLKKVLKKLTNHNDIKEGCNCRKSFCTSKYCSCFGKGSGCKPSCTCLVCRNALGKRPPLMANKRKNVIDHSIHHN